MSFVVAFNRDRDFYQVPLALHERGVLSKLITDFYSPNFGFLKSLPVVSKIKHRRVEGLPWSKVSWNFEAIKLQLMDLRREADSSSQAKVFRRLDAKLSLAALSLAARTKSNLLLYSGYAHEAFSSKASVGMVKGLFMFHPHDKFIQSILEDDCLHHPDIRWSIPIQSEVNQPLDEWKMADFILCASSFTAKSLNFVGCPSSKITVVPYGLNVSCMPLSTKVKEDEYCHFLFVGQGVQRKGLHHLFKVWDSLNLPDAFLTVVASRIDSGIGRLKPQNNVRLLGAQSKAALLECYSQADVFVMPSLVEGFGLVYLEALAAGCYCIGSSNTGFPDIQCPDFAGELVISGSLDLLSNAILNAYRKYKMRELDRAAIANFSSSLKWEKFRKDIADVCVNAENKMTETINC